MVSIKKSTINGMLWSITERFSLQGIQLVVSIILARLLEPEQFGLIGMLVIFTAVAQSILDSGFGSALIQKKDADQTDASSIFFFNLIVGISLAGILILAAPFIAKFYSQPELTSITRVISITLIINAFSLVQTALLTKNMDFRSQMKVGIIAVILSGSIGIFMAYKNMGVWSLVTQIVSNSLFRAIFLWIVNSWRPSATISFESLKSMFSFGSKLLISGLIDTIFKNIYQAFIGKVFSAGDLGYYTRAHTMQSAAVTATSSSLAQVTFPALAPFQDNDQVLRKAYKKTIRLSMFIHFPLMIGLITIADPLFRFLLTDKWASSIPFFQLLCVSGIIVPLHVLNLNILKVKGRSDLFLRLEIVKKTAVIIAIAFTFRWGILALLYGQIATSYFSYFVNSFYSGKLIGYSQKDQVKDILPSFITAVIMSICIVTIGNILPKIYFVQLFFKVITGVLVYVTTSLLINPTDFLEFKNVILTLVTTGKIH